MGNFCGHDRSAAEAVLPASGQLLTFFGYCPGEVESWGGCQEPSGTLDIPIPAMSCTGRLWLLRTLRLVPMVSLRNATFIHVQGFLQGGQWDRSPEIACHTGIDRDHSGHIVLHACRILLLIRVPERKSGLHGGSY